MASDVDRRADGNGREAVPFSDTQFERAKERFAKGSLYLLVGTVFVVLFGAFVRASLSGDGCGTSWPMCDGGVLPIGAQLKTYIELSHRATSGLLLLGVLGMAIWSFRLFPRGSAVRKASVAALAFTLVSAAIGAVLVLFSLVVEDKSVARAVTMPLHLMNTFALMGSLALMAHFARGGHVPSFRHQEGIGSAFKWSIGMFFLLGMTGAVSAMGKTAFHAELAMANSFMDRVNMHLGDTAHPILRGGVLHPLLAVATGLILLFTCRMAMERREKNDLVQKWGNWTIWLYVVQMIFGTMNLVMSAPVWMQITHLAIALANWMALVMLAVHSMPKGMDIVNAVIEEPVRERLPVKDLVKAYVALTKPRVISLLLFTTVAAMFIGARGAPSFWLILLVCVGGYMSAGAANTFNMLVEKDLDQAMERTSRRPTLTHAVSDKAAGIFAATLATLSTAILWFGAHPLAAVMALCGLLCYVFVYTLWLKRRTWHNIVIGGAAGAFPPLVGYAAVTGELSTYAWFLFALIFTWTPVHFWALAILIKDDYAKAGVPMLPVVKGDRVTVMQIGLYAVITVLLCLIPLVQGQAGWIYGIGAGLLNLGLLAQCAGLWRRVDREHARGVFKYSMVYLALIFVVIAMDRVWPI